MSKIAKIAKIVIRGEERYVSNIWFAEDDVVGDCSTTDWKEAATTISERDMPLVEAFYAEYSIAVTFEDEE